MPGGKLIPSTTGMASEAVALGIADVHDHPSTAAILQSVLHCHGVVYCRVALGMKGNGSIRQILVERYGRGGYVDRFQIETRTGPEALDNRFLHLPPGLKPIAATGKYYDG